MKKFTKDDLKTGMLVQYRNGDVRIVINNNLVGKNGFYQLRHYNTELFIKDGGTHELDIMKVSNVLTDNLLMPEYWTEERLNKRLLWEREPIETIKIGEYEYDKREVESRLSDLKPIDNDHPFHKIFK